MQQTDIPKRKVSLNCLPNYWNTEWHRNLILEIPESHEHSQVLTQVRRAQKCSDVTHSAARVFVTGHFWLPHCSGWPSHSYSTTKRGTCKGTCQSCLLHHSTFVKYKRFFSARGRLTWPSPPSQCARDLFLFSTPNKSHLAHIQTAVVYTRIQNQR